MFFLSTIECNGTTEMSDGTSEKDKASLIHEAMVVFASASGAISGLMFKLLAGELDRDDCSRLGAMSVHLMKFAVHLERQLVGNDDDEVATQ